MSALRSAPAVMLTPPAQLPVDAKPFATTMQFIAVPPPMPSPPMAVRSEPPRFPMIVASHRMPPPTETPPHVR